MTLKMFLESCLQYLLPLVVSFISLLITIIKTRQKSIEHKLDTSLTNFYVQINGVEYCLKDLSIYKK